MTSTDTKSPLLAHPEKAPFPEGSGNSYDRLDRVQRESALAAGPLKIAAYRVRDPEKGDEFGPLQFHMTYDNHVMAVMSESAAELFADFVLKTLPKKGGQHV